MLYNGSLVYLYLKYKEEWQEIGGLRNIRLAINNQLIDSSYISENSWRILSNEAGLRQITIKGLGSFSNSKAERDILKLVFRGGEAEYKLVFANMESLIGNFQISYYERFAEMDEEECYSISMESSGFIKYLFED